MKGSSSTLLRGPWAAALAEPKPFTKVGIDDFAFRRGRTYGTIIVDLETHRLIDLLPDRTVETVSAWLAAHPEIELVSRDRASDYATAATLGAPQATQVCDRRHLLKNLSEQVVTFLARMRAQIRQISTEQAPPREEDLEEEARWNEREVSEQAQNERRAMWQERKTVRDQIRETHQAERLDRDQQILQLAWQGLSSMTLPHASVFPLAVCDNGSLRGSKRARGAGVLVRWTPTLRICGDDRKKGNNEG